MPQHWTLACILMASAVVVASGSVAAEQVYDDGFANGEANLDWINHSIFEKGVVQGRSAEDAPDGDSGIGVLRHDGGRLATVSYAKTAKAENNFELSAWVYCPREATGRDGTLTGLAFYLHTEKGSSDPEEGGFYRLVCDYRFWHGQFQPCIHRGQHRTADARARPLAADRAGGTLGGRWLATAPSRRRNGSHRAPSRRCQAE